MAGRKGGLGKGLDSLIPDKGKTVQKKEKVTVSDKDVVYVDINRVEPNREQPRKNFNEDALTELSESIKQRGILEPLIVNDEKDYYMIIAGERRWRAAKMAGLGEVPVIIKNYTKQEVVEVSLIENIQREDLNSIEEALAYQQLLTEFNLKQDEIAERVSKSRTAVTNSLRLLKLDQRVQQMVIDEMITSGHARAILGISDGEKQFMLAQQIYDEKLNVRDTEKLVKKLQSQKIDAKQAESKSNSQIDAVIEKTEEKMKELLGTKVSIVRKNEKSGEIRVEYYSQEELDHLLEMFYTIKK